MKQQITPEQLDELSQEHRLKLAHWWNPLYGGSFPYTGNEKNPEWYPLLNIGQMIEFLQTYKRDKRYKSGYPTYIDFCQDYEDFGWWRIRPDWLCDDLWQEVKKTLEITKGT